MAIASNDDTTFLTPPNQNVLLVPLCTDLAFYQNTGTTYLTVGPLLKRLGPRIADIAIHLDIKRAVGTDITIVVNVGNAYDQDFSPNLDNMILSHSGSGAGYKIAHADDDTLAELGLNIRFQIGFTGTDANFLVSATAAITLKT